MKLTKLFNDGACGIEQGLYIGKLAFNSEGAAAGVSLAEIPANFVITRAVCIVGADFNAGTNNLITLGTDAGVSNLLGSGDNADGSKAAATLVSTGDDNDILITAKAPGVVGNGIKVQLKDPAGNSKSLEVTMVNDTIVVSLATSAAGTITSTAAQVIVAINSALSVKDLVVASNAADNAGTGVVVAIAATALTGGTDGSNHKAGAFSKEVWVETGAAKKTVKAKFTQTGTAATAGSAEFYLFLMRLPE